MSSATAGGDAVGGRLHGGILRPVVTNGVSHVGDGSASQGFPDGTNARRMQVAARFIF